MVKESVSPLIFQQVSESDFRVNLVVRDYFNKGKPMKNVQPCHNYKKFLCIQNGDFMNISQNEGRNFQIILTISINFVLL